MTDNVKITGTSIATDEVNGVHYQIVKNQDEGMTITVSKFGVTLKRTLYGEVTPQRLQKEKADLEHRLEQLS